MKDLIEALTIMLKYGNPTNPTICEHDELIICGINPDVVSEEDKNRLAELTFEVTDSYGDPCFRSSRFGSA